jgi:hypothetical protein
MKVDLSNFNLADAKDLRNACLKLVAECATLPTLTGKEKYELVVKTLKEAISVLPEEQRADALKWVEDVLPHVVEAALFVLPVVTSWCCVPRK